MKGVEGCVVARGLEGISLLVHVCMRHVHEYRDPEVLVSLEAKLEAGWVWMRIRDAWTTYTREIEEIRLSRTSVCD